MDYSTYLYEPKCSSCDEYYKTLEDAIYHTTRLIKLIYSADPFDSLMVEQEIDILCQILNIKQSEDFLKISRRQQILDNQIVECLNLNNQYLKCFVNNKNGI